MVWMEVVCSLLKEEALVNLIQWVATGARQRLELDDLGAPFQPSPFYDSQRWGTSPCTEQEGLWLRSLRGLRHGTASWGRQC